MSASISEEDAVVMIQLNVDVRDAVQPELVMDVPAGVSVASVTGPTVAVDDVRTVEADGTQTIVVPFKKPALGKHLINLRLEHGQSVLSAEWSVPRVVVSSVRSQRGYLVLSAGDGVRLGDFDAPETSQGPCCQRTGQSGWWSVCAGASARWTGPCRSPLNHGRRRCVLKVSICSLLVRACVTATC